MQYKNIFVWKFPTNKFYVNFCFMVMSILKEILQSLLKKFLYSLKEILFNSKCELM